MFLIHLCSTVTAAPWVISTYRCRERSSNFYLHQESESIKKYQKIIISFTFLKPPVICQHMIVILTHFYKDSILPCSIHCFKKMNDWYIFWASIESAMLQGPSHPKLLSQARWYIWYIGHHQPRAASLTRRYACYYLTLEREKRRNPEISFIHEKYFQDLMKSTPSIKHVLQIFFSLSTTISFLPYLY